MTGFPREVRTESRIEIYQFTVYDVTKDESIQSKRWGTLSAIESVRGQPLRESKRLVDASATRSNITGLTEIGYIPPEES
jgi:hypothetical protein